MKRTRLAVCVMALVACAALHTLPLRTVHAASAAPHGAQQAGAGREAAPQAVASADGQRVFATNCGFCHGGDARGGAEGGPDLTRSPIATGDRQQFIAFLKAGRPPRMPAFDLPADQVASISGYITAQALPTRGAPADSSSILVGDAAAGKAYFESSAAKCVSCHSVTGDLKGIGARYTPQQLQGRMVLARGTGGYPGLRFGAGATIVDKPRTVDVSSKGKVTKGDLVRITDFLVTLKDADGKLQTFARDGDEPKVTIHDPLQFHIDMLPKWTDRDMHNVTAYLVTLK